MCWCFVSRKAILGVDIVCQAKSGMGKTAVFVLATLHQLNPQPGEVRARKIGRTENKQGSFVVACGSDAVSNFVWC